MGEVWGCVGRREKALARTVCLVLRWQTFSAVNYVKREKLKTSDYGNSGASFPTSRSFPRAWQVTWRGSRGYGGWAPLAAPLMYHCESGAVCPHQFIACSDSWCFCFLSNTLEQKPLPPTSQPLTYYASGAPLRCLPMLTSGPTDCIVEELCSGWDILSVELFRKPGHWPSPMSLFSLHHCRTPM